MDGLTEKEIRFLEKVIDNFAWIVKHSIGRVKPDLPMGLAYCLLGFYILRLEGVDDDKEISAMMSFLLNVEVESHEELQKMVRSFAVKKAAQLEAKKTIETN